MNLLLDVIPTEVEIDGKFYKINSGFRESILFELLMQDKELSPNAQVLGALSIYYPDEVPDNLDEAINKILWFYACGEKKVNTGKEDDPDASTSSKQIYSYEADAQYIYAAFLSQYGIDLQDIDYLHWWKFKGMFNSLSDDSKIVKIMEYRSMVISPDMSKEQKDFYRTMKRLYALPDNRTEAEKETDFHNSLANII